MQTPKNNFIRTTDPLQRIGSRKQENWPARNECVSMKEENASLLMSLALNFTQGSSAMPIGEAIHAERGSFFVSGGALLKKFFGATRLKCSAKAKVQIHHWAMIASCGLESSEQTIVTYVF